MNILRQGKRLLCVVLWGVMPGFCPGAFGQDEPQEPYPDDVRILEIENRMLFFYDQLNELALEITHCSPEELTRADRQVMAVDTKWNVYYQSRQAEIAEDDSLMQIVVNYQMTKQSLLDSIAGRKHFYQAQTDFSTAETFLSNQDSAYRQMYQTAFEYSLVKALAGQLEQIKTQEQALFAEVQRQYECAKNLSDEFPEFRARFRTLEERYIVLKSMSEKIQTLEYKPWLQRVKDYLYSIAAVAMILMFISMVQAKLKTLKQARENAKKLRQMLQDDPNDYPTI